MEPLMEKQVRKLNTKGCCFLCLESTGINESVLKPVSIQSLLSHLQINLESVVAKGGKIEVDLCPFCEALNTQFAGRFRQLVKAQLEVDWFLKKMSQCILKSANEPISVQNYSKRMTSDKESLTELMVVDKLRKEVANKSQQIQLSPIVCIKLERIKLDVTTANIKSEGLTEEVDQDVDLAFHELNEDNSTLSDRSSSPGAPELKAEMKVLIPGSSGDVKKRKDPKKKPPRIRRSAYFYRHPETYQCHCKKCDKIFKTKEPAIIHYQKAHLKLKFKCNICNVAVFNDRSHLGRHKKICTVEKEKQRKNYKFVCKLCGKRFPKYTGLANHRRNVHTARSKVPCDLCDKTFCGPKEMGRHKGAVHLGITFTCGFCKKIYTDKYNLRKHEKKCEKRNKVRVEIK